MHIPNFVAVILALIFYTQVNAQSYIDTIGNTIVSIDVAVDSAHFKQTNTSGVAGAWDLHWGPDNQLWYSNSSRIEKYNPYDNAITTLLQLDKGYILGITTHLDFEEQPYVFAAIDTAGYYGSYLDHIIVKRYYYDASLDTLTNETSLLSWNHVGEHSGGRIIFGTDRKLYVSTSEYYLPEDTLFYNSGKILRVNPDGTVPMDNPKVDYTYTWGHRNPQGLTQTSNGKIFASEFGHNNDELNLIEKNNNYGWQIWDGAYCLIDPDTCDYYYTQYRHPLDIGENPPSGIDYYAHRAIPEFNGILEAVPGERGTQGIIAYGLNSSHTIVTSKNRYLISKSNDFFSAFGRIRDVCAAPNGELYFIGFDRSPRSAIYKISNPLFCTGQLGMVQNSNDDGPGSLRQAIACVYGGGSIIFSNNIENDTIILTSGPIEINKNITLTSPFTSPINIKSTSNGAKPLFYIGRFGSLNLNKINLYAEDHTGEGRIIINDGNLTLTDVHVLEMTNDIGSAILNLENANMKVNSNNSIKKQ